MTESLILLLLIVLLAYWHRDPWLYVGAGFTLIIYGLRYTGDDSYLSWFLIAIGAYSFFKAMWERKRKKE